MDRSFVFATGVWLAFAGGLVGLPRAAAAAPLKIACLGTSAMAGYGSSAGHHLTDWMGMDLGADFEVKNFAVVGATVLKQTDVSYWNRPEMKAAEAYNPDIVLFWFGGNDTFVQYWNAHKGEFEGDYTDLVQTFQALPSHPKTFLVRMLVFGDGPVQKSVVESVIVPTTDKIGVATGSFMINYHDQFKNDSMWYPDGFHPNDTGTPIIGKYFADVISADLKAAAMDGGADATTDGPTDAGGMTADVPTVTDASGTGGAAAGSGGSAGTGGAAGATGGASGSGGAPTSGSGTGGSAGTTGQSSSGSSGCIVAGAPPFLGPAGLAVVALACLMLACRRRRR
ncbi:MAG TPA: GDSL-type esterase/lipase family protein [Polyangia bacterium]|jgi:lysophospholipase L1-like esterase|nr:GDSL-type esterase/lipase family protein [Polyangia bacterium]